jgi:protein-disulfide isomerase
MLGMTFCHHVARVRNGQNVGKEWRMRFVRVSVAVLVLIFSVSVDSAQTPPPDDQMRRDIEALKEGQKAIQKDLEEIKRLLQARPAADAIPREPISIASDPFKGNRSAKVALIEFSDYQCPFCSRYNKETLPQIDSNYVEAGKIKYVFRDLPLNFHKQAFKAAEAAHCAGAQGKFWEMHDALFQNQSALAPEQLAGHARTVGVDDAQFQRCLDSGKFAADINKDIADAGAAGITGTPAFLVGVIQPDGRVRVVKKLSGAKPYAEFKAAIDSALGAP